MRITSTLIVLSLLIFSAVVFAGSFVYDDFSTAPLNTGKWNVYTNPENGFPDEYGLNTIEGKFHVLESSPDYEHARKVRLALINHSFLSGESLEYDVDYNSGNENRETTFLINGLWWATFAPNTGAVGYWNGDFDIGNSFGRYHFKLDFYDNSITLTVTKPDASTYTATKSFTSPYNFEIDTTTGHNGEMHFDFDNFIIITPQPPEPPCNCTNLTKRIDQLEQQVNNLSTAIVSIKSRVTILEALANTMQGSVDLLYDLLSNILMPFRKEMVCGAMKDNGQISMDALGLHCELKKKICKCW